MNGKLKKTLKLWCKNDLISQDQVDKILEFMKERQKQMFFSFLKWVMIIGAFWLVFGIIASIINLLELDFFARCWEKFVTALSVFFNMIYKVILEPLYITMIQPVLNFIQNIFGENTKFLYWGTVCLFLSLILISLSKMLKSDKIIDKLNLSDEQKNVLKSNWILDTISAISLASTFCLYNMLLIPENSYISDSKIIPLWNMLGAVTFITMAYKMKKNLYLIFGIYFVALSVGMFAGYGWACYWIGVSKPIIQILVAIILLGMGYITQLRANLKENNDENNYIEEKFTSTYNWTGLLMLFIALWITSFWGFDLKLANSNAQALEIWIANILFIGASIWSMYFGSKTDQKIYFNYGLTFLIIETYTVLCGRLWEHLSSGIASLLLGILLIGTAKILQKIYLKNLAKPKNIEEKTSNENS